MRGRPLSIVLLLIAVLVWGSTYVVTKNGLDDLPPMQFALLRYGVASLILVPLAVARGGLAKLERPIPWGTLVMMGLMGVGLYYTLFNLALSYTTASQVALIQSAFPAMTALLAVLLLRERLDVRRIAGTVLAIGGVALIVARSDPGSAARHPLLGNVLTFGSVVVWSTYTILAKRVSKADPISVTAIITLIGTIMLGPAALIENDFRPLTREALLAVVYLGAVASAGSYLLYNRSLRDLDATLVGIFINLSPVIGVATGVLFLREPITGLAIVGGVLVLVGVWVATVERSRRA
jgi:drug/metabolite transporter (DMT)-like permease